MKIYKLGTEYYLDKTAVELISKTIFGDTNYEEIELNEDTIVELLNDYEERLSHVENTLQEMCQIFQKMRY